MDITMHESRVRGRQPLAALGKLTIGALVGVALAVVYVMAALLGEVNPMGLAFSTLPLIAAGVMLAGWRWAPLLGVLVAGLMLAMIVPIAGFALADPSSPMFAPLLILLVLAVVGLVLGVSATAQNYRRALADRRAPRWLAATLAALAGLVAGAILVGMIPRAGSTAGVSPEVLATLPGLAAKGFEFSQTEVRVKAGETVALRLENSDPEAHFFVVDDLNINAPIPAGQSGLALFKPAKPGVYTFYCPPHYDKASGQGMKGTLIVE
ncbi:MAG: cupredoxin domain-containing protein [Roseiflexaceae bacterium]